MRGARSASRVATGALASTAFFALSCAGPVLPVEVSIPAPGGVVDVDEEAYFSFEPVAREPFLSRPIEKGTRGVWRYRVRREGGKIALVEHVTPSGIVDSSNRFEVGPDGARRIFHKSGYGETTWALRLGKDGVLTGALRSGKPKYAPCRSVAYELDDRGLPKKSTCRDVHGKAIPDANGCTAVTYVRDSAGSTLEERCFDGAMTPVSFHVGGHRYTTERNAQGRRIGHHTFDAAGKPVPDKKGCFSVAFELNEGGDDVLETCKGANDKPLARGGGKVAMTKWQVDNNGCNQREEYLDVNGKLESAGLEAVVIYRRDVHCSVVHEEHRDKNNSLFHSFGRPALEDIVLNGAGHIAEQRCRDAYNNPAACWTGLAAAGSLAKLTYDERGRRTSYRCFDLEGAPQACSHDYPADVRSRWDEMGNLVEQTFFDGEGKPAPGLQATWRLAMTYDDAGNTLSERSFGAEGEPIEPATHCHEIRRGYDGLGRLSSIECRNPKGELNASNLCLSDICWGNEAEARVAIERRPGGTTNVFYDAAGKEVRRIQCGAEPCYE